MDRLRLFDQRRNLLTAATEWLCALAIPWTILDKIEITQFTMPKVKEDKENDKDSYLQKFTIAVFGDSGVGKTSLINRLVGLKFTLEHIPTVEDFHVKHLAFQNKKCELQIIDTSGTYEFPAMRRVAIDKADALVLVYSLDRHDSFTKLERYMDEIRASKSSTKCFEKPVIVVSNKSDLPNMSEPRFVDKRGLNVHVSLHLQVKYGCFWVDTSAKTGDNVEDAFHKVLDHLLNNCDKRRKISQTNRPRRISSLLYGRKKISR